MKLFLQIDGIKQTIEVPDDTDFSLMVENYYTEQVNLAVSHGRDPANISRKIPQ